MRKEPFPQKRTVPFGERPEVELVTRSHPLNKNSLLPSAHQKLRSKLYLQSCAIKRNRSLNKERFPLVAHQKLQTLLCTRALADIARQKVSCFGSFYGPGEKNGVVSVWLVCLYNKRLLFLKLENQKR
jgi:hypothetical protein